MNKMKKFFIFIVMLVLCSKVSIAMDLSLAHTVEMIQIESQDLKKANANVKKARAGLDAVNANRWFKLDASTTYMNLINVEDPGKPLGIDLSGYGSLPPGMPSFIELPDNIGMISLTLTQPIYTFGKIGNAADAAHHAIKMADSGLELARREIRAAAAQIYWTAKMTDEIVKIAEKNLQSSKQAERQLTSAGRAGKSNLVKISADIAAKEVSLSDAQFNRDSAHRLLKIMAGIDVNTQLILTDEFPNSFVELTAPETLESNPEWDILDAQVRMYKSQAAAHRAEGYPTLSANASYNYVALHTDHKLWQGERNKGAYIGLVLSMPLWDGGAASANADMDNMAAESARQDLDKSKKIKSTEYIEAVLRHEQLRANLSKLNTARYLAARTVQISLDRFAAGQTSAVELSDVQAALMQMDMAVLNTKFNILMVEELIKKLNGI